MIDEAELKAEVQAIFIKHGIKMAAEIDKAYKKYYADLVKRKLGFKL